MGGLVICMLGHKVKSILKISYGCLFKILDGIKLTYK